MDPQPARRRRPHRNAADAAIRLCVGNAERRGAAERMNGEYRQMETPTDRYIGGRSRSEEGWNHMGAIDDFVAAAKAGTKPLLTTTSRPQARACSGRLIIAL